MDPDVRLRRMADRQLQLVTWDDALGCDLSPDQVRYRVRRGRLIEVHSSVYALPGADLNAPDRRALAACLACGAGAVASFSTAAASLGLLEPEAGDPHVTVPWSRRIEPRGIEVHRSRVLERADVGRLGVVPITLAARTLLDGASCFPDETLEQTLDNALIKHLTDCRRMLRFLERHELRRFKGIARLRELVRDRELGVPANRFERALDRIYRDYRLPPGVRQHRVRLPGRVAVFDRAHIEERVGVEADGDGTHARRLDRQRDLERDHAASHRKWKVLRFTWEHVTAEPEYVAWTIGTALGLRPTGWRK